jgi:diacylglycerol kinase
MTKPRLTWARKFQLAARGVGWAFQTQVNFRVHLALAAAVVAAAAFLQCSLVERCVLVLCITTVLAAETFNTALEHLARAVTREQHEEIRHALDTAAGAVLLTALGAATVGAVILGNRLIEWFGP